MNLQSKVFILLICCIFTLSDDIQALNSKLIYGTPVNFIIPQDDLAKDYNMGIGIYGNIDYIFNEHFGWRFDLGWNEMEGDERPVVEINGLIYTWEFTAGHIANRSAFYVEASGGHFTGIHEWKIIPAVGIRVKNMISKEVINFREIITGGPYASVITGGNKNFINQLN